MRLLAALSRCGLSCPTCCGVWAEEAAWPTDAKDVQKEQDSTVPHTGAKSTLFASFCCICIEFMTGFHFSRRLLARVSTCRQNQVSTGCPRSIYSRSLGMETHDGKQFLLLELVKNGPRSKTVKTCQDNFECLGIVLRLRVSESCCFSRFLPWERHLDRMPHNEEMVRGSDTAAACRSRKGLQHTFVGSMQDAGCLDSANLLNI